MENFYATAANMKCNITSLCQSKRENEKKRRAGEARQGMVDGWGWRQIFCLYSHVSRVLLYEFNSPKDIFRIYGCGMYSYTHIPQSLTISISPSSLFLPPFSRLIISTHSTVCFLSISIVATVRYIAPVFNDFPPKVLITISFVVWLAESLAKLRSHNIAYFEESESDVYVIVNLCTQLLYASKTTTVKKRNNKKM